MDIETRLKRYGNFCNNCAEPLKNATFIEDGGLYCTGYKNGKKCDTVHYKNPLPIAILVAPADIYGGIWVGRRTASTGPGAGGLCHPSGHIDFGESWENACRREADEELNLNLLGALNIGIWPILIGANKIGSQNLQVGRSSFIPDPGPFIKNKEISERVLYTPDHPEPLCFPIHREALAMYWDSLGIPHNVEVGDEVHSWTKR